MTDHLAAYLLFGLGLCGLLFSLGRTYYLLWKSRKERESKVAKLRRPSF